ncbi:MAG: hypothetical protein JOY64_15345 [Alphaproteobacteria bacterium]|nr:hypothetical protein [Alphaproteobacteria bacterium]
MKKALVLASVAGLLVMPSAARAQPLQYQGLYISGEGGANWMLNTMLNNTRRNELVYPRTGWVAGGSIGYDLLGPRFEVEGVYRSNNGTVQSLATPTNPTRGFNTQQTAIMANGFYDFNAGGMFVPYVGAAWASLSSTHLQAQGRPAAPTSPTKASSASAGTSIPCSASTWTAVTTARRVRR